MPAFQHSTSSKLIFELKPGCDSTLYSSESKTVTINNHKVSEIKKTQKQGFFYHAGVLTFAPYLFLLQNSGLGACTPYVLQWLVAVLLGTKNIEQSKLLNYKSLDLFLNKPIRNLHEQRKKLKEFATEENLGCSAL